MAIDGAGNLWVVDHGSGKIKAFSPGGEVLTAGEYGSDDGEFDGSGDLAVDGQGRGLRGRPQQPRVQVFVGTAGSSPNGANTAPSRASSRGHTASPWTEPATSTSPRMPASGCRSSGSCRRRLTARPPAIPTTPSGDGPSWAIPPSSLANDGGPDLPLTDRPTGPSNPGDPSGSPTARWPGSRLFAPDGTFLSPGLPGSEDGSNSDDRPRNFGFEAALRLRRRRQHLRSRTPATSRPEIRAGTAVCGDVGQRRERRRAVLSPVGIPSVTTARCYVSTDLGRTKSRSSTRRRSLPHLRGVTAPDDGQIDAHRQRDRHRPDGHCRGWPTTAATSSSSSCPGRDDLDRVVDRAGRREGDWRTRTTWRWTSSGRVYVADNGNSRVSGVRRRRTVLGLLGRRRTRRNELIAADRDRHGQRAGLDLRRRGYGRGRVQQFRLLASHWPDQDIAASVGPAIETLLDATVEDLPPGDADIWVERWRFRPGPATFTQDPSANPRYLRSKPVASSASSGGARTTLAAGDQLVVPATRP